MMLLSFLADDLGAWLVSSGLAKLGGTIIALGGVVLACVIGIYGMARSIR